MKKSYETPSAELVKFQYSEQVVAQSGGGGGDRCRSWYMLWDFRSCRDAEIHIM